MDGTNVGDVLGMRLVTELGLGAKPGSPDPPYSRGGRGGLGGNPTKLVSIREMGGGNR